MLTLNYYALNQDFHSSSDRSLLVMRGLKLDEEYMERVKGIEPSYAAWEATVLPLNYTRERRARKRGEGIIDLTPSLTSLSVIKWR